MISTAERVAELLFAFDTGTGARTTDRSVSELARLVGRERSQVSRMLKSLKQAHVVEQDPESRRYRLGWRVRVLAAQSGDQLLVRAARPMMQPLVARTGEVALLSVQEANRSLTVMREESQNSLQAGGWIGRRSAMHCTASGRVLLFDADDELVEALTVDDVKAAERRAPNCPRTVDELVARLRAERRQGYACASEEIEVGLTSVGVPVRSPQGNILAALNVSGPTSRMAGRVESTAMLLRAASIAITKSLSARSIGRLRDQW
jgi:IclR family acetate operon transcriptional repressor